MKLSEPRMQISKTIASLRGLQLSPETNALVMHRSGAERAAVPHEACQVQSCNCLWLGPKKLHIGLLVKSQTPQDLPLLITRTFL